MENKENLNLSETDGEERERKEREERKKVKSFKAEVTKLLNWRDGIQDDDEWGKVYKLINERIRKIAGHDGPKYVYFHLLSGSTVPTDSAQPMPLDTADSGFAKLLEELKAEYPIDDVTSQQAETADSVEGVLDGDDNK